MSPVMKKARNLMASGLSSRWWSEGDSNPRHADFQSAALPTELPDRIRGNGFRFDASIYSSGYAAQMQELFCLSRPFDSVYATKATRVPRAMKGAKGIVPARRESRSCSAETSRIAPLRKGSPAEVVAAPVLQSRRPRPITRRPSSRPST